MADDKSTDEIRAIYNECHNYAVNEAKKSNEPKTKSILEISSISDIVDKFFKVTPEKDEKLFAIAVMASCIDHKGVQPHKEHLIGHGLPEIASSTSSSKGLKP